LLHTNKNAIISFWKCNFLLLKTRWTYFSIISVLKKLLLEHRIYHSVMTEFLELGPFAYVEATIKRICKTQARKKCAIVLARAKPGSNPTTSEFTTSTPALW
jgi:hypothetical protein